ncbi:MFS transporter [Yinghuangia aomiensis]
MRKWGPLIAVSLGAFMPLIDTTIVIVALPEIGRDNGSSYADLQWVMDGYALALAALLLGAGALADIVGRKRVYLVGLVLFTAASLLCGLAPGTGTLVGARVLQGVGGASDAGDRDRAAGRRRTRAGTAASPSACGVRCPARRPRSGRFSAGC